MNTNLSVIIVSFNTQDLLRNCIKSVYEIIRNLSYEIIVVDNASKDGSPEMIEEEFKDVKLRKNTQNMGFARGNNQGMKVASGEYLLLLNSDTILKEGAVETLVKFMDEHPRAAAVGPKVLNFDGSLQSKGFCFPSVLLSLIILFRVPKVLSQEKLMKWFSKYYWDEDEVRRVDWISGCCLLMKRNAIEEIGPLCEEFFMYYEDEEWCYRAKKSKFEVWYVPTAEVRHKSQSSPLKDRFDIGNMSAKKYYEKTVGSYKGIVIAIIYIGSSMIKLIRHSIQSKRTEEYKDTRKRLRLQIRFLRSMLL
jgi:GT2 family glycosyltransferase